VSFDLQNSQLLGLSIDKVNATMKEIKSKYLVQEFVSIQRICNCSHFPQFDIQLLRLVFDAPQYGILHAILCDVFVKGVFTVLSKLGIASLGNVMLHRK
jgi:hypothetical protein